MDTTELLALATVARELISETPWHITDDDGIELAPGFFNVHNKRTGQSKTVLYHEESGYIFKNYFPDRARWTESGSYIGVVDDFDGVTYNVRIPRFHTFEDVTAQEYIPGEEHTCPNSYGHCDHAKLVSQATGYRDAHNGNWKIFNGEIVLFDFD